MAYPGLIKGFLQLSPEVATLPGIRVETRPPPPHTHTHRCNIGSCNRL